MDTPIIEWPSRQEHGKRFKQAIWNRLCQGPATAPQLHAWCHQFHPQDCPASCDSIKSLISTMNAWLRTSGCEWRIKNMGGRGGRYHCPYRIVHV